jgi:hypothetical protein
VRAIGLAWSTAATIKHRKSSGDRRGWNYRIPSAVRRGLCRNNIATVTLFELGLDEPNAKDKRRRLEAAGLQGSPLEGILRQFELLRRLGTKSVSS